jgi:membrane-associated protease RseP (regulator of RpoE activity)
MSGPKHLWSGDWQSESVPPPEASPPVVAQEPDVLPAQEPLFTKRQIAIAVGAGIATAAVTLGLVTAFGGNSPKPRSHARTRVAAPRGNPQGSGGKGLTNPTRPSQVCQQNRAACPNGNSTPVVSGPSANWLGMQIITSPAGVVVNYVKVGSLADQAGFEPGDEIEAVDNHQINSVRQLRSDTNRIRLGGPVTILVLRSSVTLQAGPIPMTQRPTIHP